MSGSDRLERKALETVHSCMAADVQLASPERGWDMIAAGRCRLGRLHVELPPLGVPAYGVSYGPAIQLEGPRRPRAVRFKPGNLAIVAPDVATQWACNQVCDLVAVCLSWDAIERFALECTPRSPRTIEIIPSFGIRDLVLERVAHQLLREMTQPETGMRMRVQARTYELAMHLLRAHSNLDRRLDRQARTIPPHKLKRAKEYICANLARDLSLDEVAAVAGMTKFHFAKAFRQATGRAPHRYLTEHRILRGRTLLHDRNLSIHDIAGALGFTHSHFTRLFTRHMGMTPTAFRKLL
jgi:AraC family transcriptional regulator